MAAPVNPQESVAKISLSSAYPSDPLVTINIPEPKIHRSEFVYNCYERDERVNERGIQILVEYGDPRVTNLRPDHIPRYNRINFGPYFSNVGSAGAGSELGNSLSDPWTWDPRIFTDGFLNEFDLRGWLPSSPETLLSWNFDDDPSEPAEATTALTEKLKTFVRYLEKILSHPDKGTVLKEDAISNSHFSSGYIRDNEIDNKFYRSFRSTSQYFGGFDSAGMTPTALADMMLLRTNITGSYFSSGVAIRDALTNLQPQGVHYADTDNTENQIIDAVRSVRLVNFGQNYNCLVNRDLFISAIEDPLSVYYDEFFMLVGAAQYIQDTARSMPPEINVADWNLTFDPLYQEYIGVIKSEAGLGDYRYDRFTDEYVYLNEKSCPLGFMIEKYCLHNDGTVQRFPPIFRWGWNNKTFIDSKIRYGLTYIYVIRTITLCVFEACEEITIGQEGSQSIYAWTLALSKGRFVHLPAVESIAPPPPGPLFVNFDYERDCTYLEWQPPLEPQRDIVKYQVFRRDTIHQPFTLIGQIDFDHSLEKFKSQESVPKNLNKKYKGPIHNFHDTSFKRESDYIYAIVAIDAHGLNSCYSPQIGCKFDSYQNRLITNHVSFQGSPKPYPNLYLSQDLFVDTMKDSGSTRMRVFFDPEYSKLSDSKIVTIQAI